jgi:M6 family metalloprotease-like protein
MNKIFSVLLLIVLFSAVTFAVPALFGRTAIDSVATKRITLSRSPEIGRTAAPVSGTVNILFIKVQFQLDTNDKTSGTGQFPYNVWGPTADNEVNYFQTRMNNVKKYYNEVSGGEISINTNIVGPFTLNKKMEDYGSDLSSPNLNVNKTILEDTVKYLSNVSLSQYHIICLIHAGAGAELGLGTGVKDLYSLFRTLTTPVQAPDGTNIYSFALIPETQCNDSMFNTVNSGTTTADDYAVAPDKTIINALIPKYWDVTGTWVHEIAHAFGLPDLYNTNPATTGISLYDWSLMAHGSYLPFPEGNQDDPVNVIPHADDEVPYGSKPSHLDAWSKLQLGWANLKTVTDSNSISISSQQYISGRKSDVYKLWTDGNINSSNEYFLLENRSLIGYDEYLPEPGLMVYHIDDSVGIIENNNLQQDSTHPRIFPLSADNKFELSAKYSGATISDYVPSLNTVFPGTDSVITILNDDSSPATRKYNGDKSWVSISNITQVVNSISANVSVSSPGTITLITPEDKSTIYGTMPEIKANIGSLQSPSIYLDGSLLLSSISDNIISGKPSSQLSIGTHLYSISGTDRITGDIVTIRYSFTIIQKQISSGIRMMSIPLVNVGSASSVFSGVLLNDKLCRYDPITKRYVWYPSFDFNESSTIAATYSGKTSDGTLKAPAGMGFWTKLSSNTILNLYGDTLTNDVSINIRLEPGFNMVGNPFVQPVSLSNCMIELSGVKYTFANAVTRGYVSTYVYSFNGSGYEAFDFKSVTLQPWSAYWVEVKNQSVRLIVTPVNRNAIVQKSNKSDLNNWDFKINVRNEDNGGTAHYAIGVSSFASDSYDRNIDISAPPVSPLGVSIVNRSSSVELMGDFKATFNDEKYWDFKVRTVAGNNIVSTSDLINIPGKYDVILQDLVSGVKLNLRNSPSYSFFLPEASERDFKIIIKKRSLNLGIQNLHQELSKRDNTTKISWTSNQDGLCSLEIRNISGRLVFSDRINVVSAQVADYSWDGKDFNGKSVPSGTYQFTVKLNSTDGRVLKAVTIINK